MRREILHAIMILAVVGLAIQSARASEEPLHRFEFERVEMGVLFRLALYATDQPSAKFAANSAFERIAQLNGIMSDYDSQSELSQLCRKAGPDHPVKVSPELQDVLSRSLELSGKSEGAFDVSVGPLTRLWRHARRRQQLPTEQRLAEARERVGYQWIRLDEAAGTVTLLKPRMELDLGGIAKGYAADEALRVLARHGIDRALVDASGDISVSNPPPGKEGWRIAVDGTGSDSQNRQHALSLVPLSNRAIATSGDAFQHVEIDGKRYSHIVDPSTGLGLTTPGSVTIIADDGVTADSLASAVSVLGAERGLKLVEQTPGAAALITLLEGGVLHESRSSRWPCSTEQEPIHGD